MAIQKATCCHCQGIWSVDLMNRRATPQVIESVKQRLAGRSLVLVGMMGAGKTTVGRRLARRLDLPFTDADAEIETAAGKTIAEIFADHGESYFRDGERRVIARLLDSGQQVIATGGGAFNDAGTRRKIADRGVSVWLKADLDVLMKRVMRRATRPLLQADDPRGVMTKLLQEREPYYRQADVTVVSREAPHASVVNDALKALDGFLDG